MAKDIVIKTGSIGVYGTKMPSGYLSEEYNTRLQGTAKWDEWERMHNDAHVNQIKTALFMPIMRAKWEVERAGDKPIDREIEEFAKWQMFEREQSFSGLLQQILDYTFDGVAWFEKVYQTEDWKPEKGGGKRTVATWKEIAYRYPRSLYRYEFHKGSERIKSVVQYAEESGTGNYEEHTIPIDKLIFFTFMKHGIDIEGKGINRIIYKPYKMKDLFEKCLAVFNDRYAAGVPIMSYPEGTPDPVTNKLEEMLQKFRGGEHNYILKPDNIDFDVVAGVTSGQRSPIIESIKLMEQTIAKTILAQFLNLGTTESGSRSLGESGVNFFLLSMQAIANQIAEILTKNLHQLLGYNWSAEKYADNFPVIKATGIEKRDVKMLADAYKVLSDAGTIDSDKETEQHWRDILNLPKLSDEEIEHDVKMRQEKLKQEKEDLKNGVLPENKVPSPEVPEVPKEEIPNGEKPSEAGALEKKQPIPVKPDKKVEAIDCTCGVKHFTGDEDGIKAYFHGLFADIISRNVPRLRPERAMTPFEEKVVSFEEVERRIVTLQNRVGMKAANFFTSYMETITKKAIKGDDPRGVRPKDFDKFIKSIKLEQREAHTFGREKYMREYDIVTGKTERVEFTDDNVYTFAKKEVKPNPMWLDDLEEQSDVVMTAQVRRIQDNALKAQMRVKRLGFTGLEKVSVITESVGTLSMDGLTKEIKSTVNVAYGEGRISTSAKLKGEKKLKEEMYTAIFDNNICASCAPKHGMVHLVGDANYEAPNPECYGGDACRCENVPMGDEELV